MVDVVFQFPLILKCVTDEIALQLLYSQRHVNSGDSM